MTASMGPRAVIAVLQGMAGGLTVAQAAAAHGVTRSAAYLAAASLEQAGMVWRDSKGVLHPGTAARRMGFARFGLGALAGRAEAVILWLREQTGAMASLSPAAAPEVILAGQNGEGQALMRLGVTRPDGTTIAEIRLWAPARNTPDAAHLLQTAQLTLSACLEADP